MSIIAKVKSVSSGDTLLLQSTNTGAEKTLSLAYVSAPRLKRDGEEPYAFKSRDFLRKLVVGKEVKFSVLYKVPTSGREYGIATLQSGDSLVERSVAEGYVKVREDAGKRDDQGENDSLVEKLKLLEANARTESKGVWGDPEDGRIDCKYDLPSSDAVALLEKYKNKPLDAIVERVITGDRVVVRLTLEPKLHQQSVLLVAGIKAPLSKRIDASGSEQAAEEFGEDARNFVESKLLQRSVKISLLGLSPQSQFIGSVLHPAGNIAEAVLLQGLARCIDFHSTMIGADMSKLRGAEKHARESKLRLWKDYVPKKDGGGARDAVVTRIMSADTLLVKNKAGVEKINLSSVRQPKPSDPKQSPFQAEAKEFLRKKLIGKRVLVHIDGKRPPTEGFGEREMATVTFNNKNIALLLVENGYASVIRHRMEDDDRSPIYDELLAAEEAAQKAQKGMYTTKPPPATKLVEASESITKAKAHLAVLQRQKRIPAVVDFVASGSRFKVIIPRENARLTLVLGGIRAPRTTRNASEQSEPFGQEALDYSTKRCMQRDVEIDIHDIDRIGGFIGTLYVNRESIAKGLLEEGFATVHAYSAEKSGHGSELFAAEKKAKEARKGIWHSWTPEQDESGSSYTELAVGTKKEEPIERKKDYRDVIVTNVDDQGKMKVQLIGTGTAALEELMTAFRKFHSSPTNDKGLENPPKVGEYVAAKFTEDNTFYRARVRHVNRETKEAEVNYIDYGNSEKIPFSRLRPLSQPQFQISKLKPQAIDAQFSFIQFPTQSDYVADSVDMINHLTADKQLVANVDWIGPDGVMYLTLYDPKNSDRSEASLNSEIVGEGFAMVPFKLRPFERAYSEVLKALKDREASAKAERRGMWEYGDITED